MNTFIVLLRGINVGGHKKVPMAELRALLAEHGFIDVKTYIQSGNIIFKSSKTKLDVEQKVQQVIQSHFGFEVPVIVRTRPDLLRNFMDCPFSEDKKANSYFVLLSQIPSSELVDAVGTTVSYDNETFHIINDCLYFYTSKGYGNSKFNMTTFERKLKVKATSRNYKTLVKLLELSDHCN